MVQITPFTQSVVSIYVVIMKCYYQLYRCHLLLGSADRLCNWSINRSCISHRPHVAPSSVYLKALEIETQLFHRANERHPPPPQEVRCSSGRRIASEVKISFAYCKTISATEAMSEILNEYSRKTSAQLKAFLMNWMII